MVMMEGHLPILDWPAYKEQYPEKTMEDYIKYSSGITIQNVEHEFEKEKDNLSNEEIAAIQAEINEMKNRHQ